TGGERRCVAAGECMCAPAGPLSRAGSRARGSGRSDVGIEDTTMRRFALLAIAACTQAASPNRAPRPPATVHPRRPAEDVRLLASDSFLGRGPATPGEDKAVAYIADQFRAAGLQPGGPNGSWFQEVPLNQYSIVGAPDLSYTVAEARHTLTQGEQIAV